MLEDVELDLHAILYSFGLCIDFTHASNIPIRLKDEGYYMLEG